MAEQGSACDFKIGVLALQGAFREHVNIYVQHLGVDAVTIRTPEELADPQLKALVIPGMWGCHFGLVGEVEVRAGAFL